LRFEVSARWRWVWRFWDWQLVSGQQRRSRRQSRPRSCCSEWPWSLRLAACVACAN